MKILVVDDSADVRLILSKTLESRGYTVITASDGAEALKIARETPPDMIISDVLMPVMDGFQLLRQCKADPMLAGIPYVFYSAAYTDRKDEEFGLSMGAVKFIVKPMGSEQFLEIIEKILNDYEKGVLNPSAVHEKKDEGEFLRGYNDRLIRQLEKKVEDLQESNRALRRSEAELKDLFESFVRTMVNTLDAKSGWTKGHSERVVVYAEQIAREIGLGAKDMADLKMAALLHDIGKIGMKDYLLDKPSGLTEVEFDTAKRHVELGAEILEHIKQLRHIIPAILNHHERTDGTGYPRGLKGKEIGLYADIIHIADSFDSMTADRPYRDAMGEKYAISELKRLAGLHFKSELVEAFLRALERKSEADKSGS